MLLPNILTQTTLKLFISEFIWRRELFYHLFVFTFSILGIYFIIIRHKRYLQFAREDDGKSANEIRYDKQLYPCVESSQGDGNKYVIFILYGNQVTSLSAILIVKYKIPVCFIESHWRRGLEQCKLLAQRVQCRVATVSHRRQVVVSQNTSRRLSGLME